MSSSFKTNPELLDLRIRRLIVTGTGSTGQGANSLNAPGHGLTVTRWLLKAQRLHPHSRQGGQRKRQRSVSEKPTSPEIPRRVPRISLAGTMLRVSPQDVPRVRVWGATAPNSVGVRAGCTRGLCVGRLAGPAPPGSWGPDVFDCVPWNRSAGSPGGARRRRMGGPRSSPPQPRLGPPEAQSPPRREAARPGCLTPKPPETQQRA